MRDVVYQGDFLEIGKSLGNRKFDVVIADPPYNIGKNFGNNHDMMELTEYLEWTDRWVSICLNHLTKNGIIYIYGYSEILARISARFPITKQRWLVWHYTNKTVPQLKFWQRSHESILCLWDGAKPKLQIDQIREEYTDQFRRCIGKPRRETRCRYNQHGNTSIYNGHKNGALPRDVLKVPALAGGAGSSERWFMCRTCDNQICAPSELQAHENHDILKHPTQKPMKLTTKLLRSCINGKGGSVLIPFAGSGSECVVAQSLGINFLAVELNPEYVDFAHRWLSHMELQSCIT